MTVVASALDAEVQALARRMAELGTGEATQRAALRLEETIGEPPQVASPTYLDAIERLGRKTQRERVRFDEDGVRRMPAPVGTSDQRMNEVDTDHQRRA